MGWVFHVFGIPVRVQPFFLFAGLILGRHDATGPDWLTKMIIWLLAMFTGVLAHELGHALVGRVFGLSPNIELHGFGGLTWWDRSHRLSPLRDIAISAAGPLVGIFIGITAMFVGAALLPDIGTEALEDASGTESLASFTVSSIIWVNFWWGVLNLVPMMPLDGGNIMAAIFEIFAKDRGRRVARYVSLVVAAAIVAFALFTHNVLMAVLIAFLAWANIQALRAEKEQQPAAEDPARSDLERGYAALERRELTDARKLAERARAHATTERARGEAAELLAWTRVLSGDAQGAREALSQTSHARPHPALEGAILLELGEAERALPFLQTAVSDRTSPAIQELLSRAFIQTKQFPQAAAFFGSARGDNAHPETIFKVEKGAYEAGDFETAARLGEILFEREGEPIRAFNVACSLARAGKAKDALEWLERAAEAGFDDSQLFETDNDLDMLRGEPKFSQVRERISRNAAQG